MSIRTPLRFTKITPPRWQRHALLRERLRNRLLEARDFRLTLLQAGTGYGKSTTLTSLTRADAPLAWYHITPDDADPLLFLLHLYHGLRQAVPAISDAPLAQLESWGHHHDEDASNWNPVVDALIEALHEAARPDALFLIFDDFHLVQEASATLQIVDRFLARLPAGIHAILSTRYALTLPSLNRWRVHGELQTIDQAELAFTASEIETLFERHYGRQISSATATRMLRVTEGWPIALPLIQQRLQRNQATTVDDVLAALPALSDDLFAYLGTEVLEAQPRDVREFLLATSVLRTLTPTRCNQLRQTRDAETILRYLHDNGLFIVDLGHGHSRYHHLFRELLRRQLTPAQAHLAHLRAAAECDADGDMDEAIYHKLAAAKQARRAGDDANALAAFADAATLLAERGRQLVRTGRLDALSGWLNSFPPDVMVRYPALLTYLGDLARLRGHFDRAMAWYREAETHARKQQDWSIVSQAIRGQARVYLDTVNPVKADTLLQEALRISDAQESSDSRARLLTLLAENLLNQGKFQEAEAYQEQARQLRHATSGPAEMSARLLLRTGRLQDAATLLEARAEREKEQPVLRPRAHRETTLLLALVYAFQGRAKAAQAAALAGTERGKTLQSDYVIAVGLMRQGHTWLLSPDANALEEAERCFEGAIEIGAALGVRRLKVEALWGLTRLYGMRGNLALAQTVADEGIALAQEAGDEWIEALLRLALGASLVEAGSAEAAPWLDQASLLFRDCGDRFGLTATTLWQASLWQRTGDKNRLARDLGAGLRAVAEHHFGFLFEQRSLAGPAHIRAWLPLLVAARDQDIESRTALALLERFGLAEAASHPGYQLRIATLGALQVWRGDELVGPAGWRRQKARQLFLLLLTHRNSLLEREQIIDMLWPELDGESGARDFKIAFTTLSRVLEPERQRQQPYAFIVRDGSRYGLHPHADIWIDADDFTVAVAAGDALLEQEEQDAIPAYRQAIALYRGDYLQEYPYADWCSEERERLHARCLRTADRLARLLGSNGAWDEAVEIADFILRLDDCWEGAYRLQMEAHAALGNHTQVVRIYQRCCANLAQKLAIEPSPATQALYARIVSHTELPADDSTH